MDAKIKTAGYENIYIDCPCCKHENVFNRISDLEGNNCIDRLNGIVCQSCERQFSILGDRVTTAKFRWFLDELPIFKKRKEYRLYILNLCQGVECFFSQAIINKLIDRDPNLRDDEGHIIIGQYNKAREELDKKTVYDLCQKGSRKITFKRTTFNKLEEIFLCLFDYERKNDNGNLSKLRKDKREESFQEIGKTKINTIRNRVVHKQAYRPSVKEIEDFDSLIKALYYLQMYLDVKDSIFLLNKKLSN